MFVAVFRSRARADLDAGVVAQVERLGLRMAELAAGMPGFVSYKDFAAEDGETVTIVEFETHEAMAAWGAHPEHRAVQQLGRDSVFSEYTVQVCEQVRVSRFPR
jgi:heme-degrading monooxygenase HmoA